jgi:pyrroloquinoline quinone biosynthesis protein E
VLPCHAAAGIPDLEFWSVVERPFRECWEDAPGMNEFRGEGWLPEPCRSCDERTRDFGGCRCQAFQLTGDARVTDPACELAPQHDLVIAARERASATTNRALRLRGS